MKGIDLRIGDMRQILAQLPSDSVDSVVTDPPYELNFMGRTWDRSGIAFDPKTWAECYRVLKPGGHLIAFGGQRTLHRITCAVEDAGFDIRDMIGWLYYSGFPKSLDVGMDLDKQRHDRDDVLKVTAWVREVRDRNGLTNKDIDAAFGFTGMGGHWTSSKSQPAVPTLDQIPVLLNVLRVPVDDVPEPIRRLMLDLNGAKGTPGKAWYEREVVDTRTMVDSRVAAPMFASNTYYDGVIPTREVDITVAASEAAKTWEGWGTALKPAIEPCTLARKPMPGTVANNILRWGTGAINVQGCRYAIGDPAWPGPQDAPEIPQSTPNNRRGEVGADWSFADTEEFQAMQAESIGRLVDLGRWPANVYYCPKPSRAEKEAGCEALPSRTPAAKEALDDGAAGLRSPRAGAGRTQDAVKNHHPTVKPVGLMRWLVRLVTPPKGTVLDPFTGSGTTAVACVHEGFRFTGCDLEPDFIAIANARASHAHREKWGMLADIMDSDAAPVVRIGPPVAPGATAVRPPPPPPVRK